MILQKELSESKKKTILLENEITKKDATISKLKLELEEAQKKKPERKIEIERERSQPGSPILDELELPIRDDRETHSEGGHSSKLEIDRKRKSNEPDIFDDDFNKDNEEVQSEIDKFKFRKLFKKVKKTGEQSTSIKSTGTHQDLKSKMFVPLEAVKGNLKDNDEGSELHNLLNNFSESTKTLEKRNSSAQSNEAAQNQLNNKEDSHSSNKLAKEKLNDAKMLKKENGGNFFTQQGAINDSLERELFPPETSVLPITSKDKSSQLMQKMMKSNQKRNTANTMSNSFFKINESQKTTPIESPRENPKEEKKSEPVPTRGVHRSKQERENLQGFECDQCQKVKLFSNLLIIVLQFHWGWNQN